MPLQNRVDPFGEIHAVQARGLFTGNRGVIHDPATKTLLKRRWTTRAWIVCVCAFKGRRRAVMGRNAPSGGAGWTELFFLDEVTALAAGHRPCLYCRRAAARDFMDRFATAAGLHAPRVADLDGRLHAERCASGGARRSISGEAAYSLPDGAMVAHGDAAYAIRDGKALAWRFHGYEAASLPAVVMVLTPQTTIDVLAAGYRPVWHGSA